ncbi:hypothetical protein KAX75_12165, partial [candidate division WOR-3 bacterium]|nr:hypothetical protein [candidate division WOR-3 bacterium]
QVFLFLIQLNPFSYLNSPIQSPIKTGQYTLIIYMFFISIWYTWEASVSIYFMISLSQILWGNTISRAAYCREKLPRISCFVKQK